MQNIGWTDIFNLLFLLPFGVNYRPPVDVVSSRLSSMQVESSCLDHSIVPAGRMHAYGKKLDGVGKVKEKLKLTKSSSE